MTRATLSWGLVAAYLLFLYATLPIMPWIWHGLDAFLGGRGVWAIFAATGVLLFAWLVLMLLRGIRDLRTYLAFCLFCGLLIGLGTLEDNPGEKIHMLQYAILGILVHKALSQPIPPSRGKLLFRGALFCLAAGAMDETIQYFLAARSFTWHDVLVNGASGMLALFILMYCLPKRTDRASESSSRLLLATTRGSVE